MLEFHQAVLSTLREEEINQENFAADVQRLNELAEMTEIHEDDGPEGEQGRLFLHVVLEFLHLLLIYYVLVNNVQKVLTFIFINFSRRFVNKKSLSNK